MKLFGEKIKLATFGEVAGLVFITILLILIAGGLQS
jgi:hypothetical protein